MKADVSSLALLPPFPRLLLTQVSRKQLLAKLDVCMGGRVAEELIFGDAEVTTGASSDLQQATRLARDMVTKYGMSDSVGLVSQNYEDDGRSISSETRARIETEVKSILQGAHERARRLLEQHKDELHVLASGLLQQETLTGQQITELLAAAGKGGKSAAAALAAGAGAGVKKATTVGAQGGVAAAAASVAAGAS